MLRHTLISLAVCVFPLNCIAEPINIKRYGYEAEMSSPSYLRLSEVLGKRPTKPRDFYYALEIANKWERNNGQLTRPRTFEPTNPGEGKVLTVGTITVTYNAILDDAAAVKSFSLSGIPLTSFSCQRDPETGGDIDHCVVLSSRTQRLPPILYQGVGGERAETFTVEGVLKTVSTNDTAKWIAVGKAILGFPAISATPAAPVVKAGLELAGALDAMDTRDRSAPFSATLAASGGNGVAGTQSNRLSGIAFFNTKQKLSFGSTQIRIVRQASLLFDELRDQKLLASEMMLAKLGPIDFFASQFEKAFDVKAPTNIEDPTKGNELRAMCRNLDIHIRKIGVSYLDGLLLKRSYLMNAGFAPRISDAEHIKKLGQGMTPAMSGGDLQKNCWDRDSDRVALGVAKLLKKELEKFGSY